MPRPLLNDLLCSLNCAFLLCALNMHRCFLISISFSNTIFVFITGGALFSFRVVIADYGVFTVFSVSLLSACAVSLFSVISLFSAYSVLSLYFVFSAYSVISPSSVVSLFSAYSVNSPCSLSLAVLSVILLTFVSNLSNFLILLLLYNFDLTFFS